MTIQEYLLTELQDCSKYTLSEDDRKQIKTHGIEEFIYRKLTSKKFRKWAVDPSSETQAKGAIHLNVDQNKPLQFRYPFGGYKLWRMPGYPEVDWAEFFSIAYYCRYLAPIAAAYKPGIELIFASDDLIIERMDNIPTKDTDAYFDSFKNLVRVFGAHLPANFKLDIVRIADLYPDKEEMESELAANIAAQKETYATSADDGRKQKMLTTSELNIRWDGARDLTGLSDTEKQAHIAMGPIYHDAYCALSKRKNFNRGEDKIVLFTTVIPNAIAIGTTKSSVTKFWTGYGVVEQDDDTYRPKILPPTHLETATRQPQAITLPGLSSKNFQSIDVLAP